MLNCLDGNEGSVVDPDLDPDLQMLRDEHQRQLRVLREELDKLRKEKEHMEKQKDEWQVEAEAAKETRPVSSDGESEVRLKTPLSKRRCC